MAKRKTTAQQTQKPAPQKTAYIIAHTHWDREWRYPLWETRHMLVAFIDELVELLEKGVYANFLLDGQVIPVLDYLEVRPEMTARVKALVQAGKLEIGPWYTLPDEFPVDGEALVRNLLWGDRLSRKLGGVLKVGYTAFGWGQTAQLPQIYNGFGLEVMFVGKRVNKDRAPQSEFIWRAPDGSELLTSRFGSWGRQNFYFKVHLTSLFGIEHEGPEWHYQWSKGGNVFHRADAEQYEQDMFRLDAPARWYPEMITQKMLDDVWATTDESVLEHDRAMMNGCDYAAAQRFMAEMVARVNEVDAGHNRQWIQCGLTDYVKVLQQKTDASKLPVVNGELRDGPAAYLTGNALATRMVLKRLNKKAQNMLIRFAEPMSALVAMRGAGDQGAFLEKAWKLLLESHSHDAINGVTQDDTATDVAHRLDQVIQLSQAAGNHALQELVQKIDLKAYGDSEVLLVVVNPAPFKRRQIVRAWVDVQDSVETYPMMMPPVMSLQISGADGKPVSTQWRKTENRKYGVHEIHTRAFPFYCKRHEVFFDAGELPAGGYKVFTAREVHPERDRVEWSDLEARTSTLLKAPNVIENEHLKIDMHGNGTFDLTAKKLGQVFKNLNYFEDHGEHGDYWTNRKPMHDQAHVSLGCEARIWAEESGPLQATLVSEVTMRLPRRGIREQQRRGDELVDLVLRTAVTLQAGCAYAKVKVEFENEHEDHCLRVLFPTGLKKASHADVGGHFTVDHRPIRPQGPTPKSVWPDMGRLPQSNFVDVSDGAIGLAVLNEDLTEYEVSDSDERVLALTLLRAVPNSICTELRCWANYESQKGGQSLGQHSAHYALYPHQGDWQAAQVPLQADLFNVPVRVIQTRQHAGELPGTEAALFEIDHPQLRFSCLKKTQDRDTFTTRIYNPTASAIAAKVRFHAVIAEAWLTNLNEERQHKAKVAGDHEITINAGPHKIVTLEVRTTPKGK